MDKIGHSSFFLGIKDAVVDTVGSIAGIFSNLSGTLKSAVYLCTIFSCPLFENEREKVTLSLYNQMGDWMDKEIFYGNANDRARATGYILGSVIMAAFSEEEFAAITKALKVVSESKALIKLDDALKGFTKLNKYEDVIENATLKEKVTEVIEGGCFTGDTLVETDNGFKRIDEIQVGDTVPSWNPETKANEYKKVISLYQAETIYFLFTNLKKERGVYDSV